MRTGQPFRRHLVTGGEGLRIDFPQIPEVASIYRRGTQVTINTGTMQNNKFNEDNIFYTDPSFFSMFHFEWLNGSAAGLP